MREFVILEHNRNSVIRWSLIILVIALTTVISNFIELNYFAALAPTGLIIVASVIHHIYNENYEEVGKFWFSEEGIYISKFNDNSEQLLRTEDLKTVLICYSGYYGQEHKTHSLDWQTTTGYGDSNYIQIETIDERLRYCFFGNNSGDSKHLSNWSEYFTSNSVRFKASSYISFPKFIRKFFDKPLKKGSNENRIFS